MFCARENGLQVILNPAPARDLPEELIALTDYLIPNEIELSLLSGMEMNTIAPQTNHYRYRPRH